jgi:hypothetical protein
MECWRQSESILSPAALFCGKDLHLVSESGWSINSEMPLNEISYSENAKILRAKA